ncbi:unnamed protein product, partial [Protopolystoma xenopodis]
NSAIGTCSAGDLVGTGSQSGRRTSSLQQTRGLFDILPDYTPADNVTGSLGTRFCVPPGPPSRGCVPPEPDLAARSMTGGRARQDGPFWPPVLGPRGTWTD